VPYACRYGVRAFGPITPVADDLATEAHDYLLKPSIVKGTFDYWCRQADRL
jgi:L-fuculose-phosphate aldolase